MKLIIKNWSKHQYKFRTDRTVKWIKVHKDLLRDYHFCELTESDKYKLVALWLICDPYTGEINKTEKEILFDIGCKSLNLEALHHFITESAADSPDPANSRGGFADSRESSPPREEESREENSKEEKSILLFEFDMFWDLYPKHRRSNKSGVLKEFKIHKKDIPEILTGLKSLVKSFDWTKDNGQFVPAPMKFLKEKRWIDETDSGTISDVKKMEDLGL